ncbi:hypothetical protein [Streptomyces lasiicapitis]|nr:hypothetical protein [Streptomyces lasiicapitis]
MKHPYRQVLVVAQGPPALAAVQNYTAATFNMQNRPLRRAT